MLLSIRVWFPVGAAALLVFASYPRRRVSTGAYALLLHGELSELLCAGRLKPARFFFSGELRSKPTVSPDPRFAASLTPQILYISPNFSYAALGCRMLLSIRTWFPVDSATVLFVASYPRRRVST